VAHQVAWLWILSVVATPEYEAAVRAAAESTDRSAGTLEVA
jgi:hypothetical protein